MTSDLSAEVFSTGVVCRIVIPKPSLRVPVANLSQKRHPVIISVTD
jgi:hypothetical protein